MFIVPKHTGRWIFGVSYVAFTGAGISYWLSTSVLLERASASQYLPYVWATLLIVGGLSCFMTTITDMWLGEYAGLLLLASVFVTYSVAAFLSAGLHPTEWAFPFLCLAWSGLLIAQWWRLHKFQHIARKIQTNGGQ